MARIPVSISVVNISIKFVWKLIGDKLRQIPPRPPVSITADSLIHGPTIFNGIKLVLFALLFVLLSIPVRVSFADSSVTKPSLASATPLPFPAQTEGFEYGLGDWQPSNGIWEVGVPTSGPTPDALGNRAHEGVAVLATVLNGNYPDNQKSRISSIAIVVPTAGENPRLRFWHWWSFASNDWGQVQVSTDNGATW